MFNTEIIEKLVSHEDLNYYHSEYDQFKSNMSQIRLLVRRMEDQCLDLEDLCKEQLRTGNRTAAKNYLILKKQHTITIKDFKTAEMYLENAVFF